MIKVPVKRPPNGGIDALHTISLIKTRTDEMIQAEMGRDPSDRLITPMQHWMEIALEAEQIASEKNTSIGKIEISPFKLRIELERHSINAFPAAIVFELKFDVESGNNLIKTAIES